MQFSYANPTTIHFGQGQISAIASSIPQKSTVLVVYGGGSIKKNGVYDQVSSALKNHSWVEFSGVEPNPTIETLNKAVEMVKQQNVDYILAVGGGSVIDGSKYVAAASHYDGDGWDILTGKYVPKSAVSLGCILTLPATGSESNSGAVITRKETQDKLAFMSPHCFPKFAVLDPDAMKTLPERQLANGLVDAWVHVCEQYLTMPTGAMVQDGYAEALLKNLLVLGAQFNERDTNEWRANLMYTANQALNGLIGTGVPQDWATHMIGHEITAIWGVDHARSLAIVQPSLLRNQLQYKKGKLEQMGRNVFGIDTEDDLAEETIQAIEAFYHSLDVATILSESSSNKAAAITKVIAQLESHGFVKLGENGTIDMKATTEILEEAFA